MDGWVERLAGGSAHRCVSGRSYSYVTGLVSFRLSTWMGELVGWGLARWVDGWRGDGWLARSFDPLLVFQRSRVPYGLVGGSVVWRGKWICSCVGE